MFRTRKSEKVQVWLCALKKQKKIEGRKSSIESSMFGWSHKRVSKENVVYDVHKMGAEAEDMEKGVQLEKCGKETRWDEKKYMG